MVIKHDREKCAEGQEFPATQQSAASRSQGGAPQIQLNDVESYIEKVVSSQDEAAHSQLRRNIEDHLWELKGISLD